MHFVLIFQIIKTKRGKTSEYIANLILSIILINLFVYETITLYSIAIMLLMFAIYNMHKILTKNKIKKKKPYTKEKTKYPYALFLTSSNLIMYFIVFLFLNI